MIGAMPVYAARWLAEVKVLASPMVRRRCRLDLNSWHGHQDDGKREVAQQFSTSSAAIARWRLSS
jgi:hypothetical protein